MERTKSNTSQIRPPQQRHPQRMHRLRYDMAVTLLVVVIITNFLLPNECFQHYANASSSSSSSTTTCDLECPTNIGSKCEFGESPYLLTINATTSSSSTKSINGMHCSCPEFYTGIHCEFTFDSCNDQNQHVCLHGGSCQSGGIDPYGNTQHYCDCRNANDPVTQNPYVGKYCELATVSTCDDPVEPNLFCFNGGVCNDKYP